MGGRPRIVDDSQRGYNSSMASPGPSSDYPREPQDIRLVVDTIPRLRGLLVPMDLLTSSISAGLTIRV